MTQETPTVRLETVKHVVGWITLVYIVGAPVDPSKPSHVHCSRWRETPEAAEAKAREWITAKGYTIAIPDKA